MAAAETVTNSWEPFTSSSRRRCLSSFLTVSCCERKHSRFISSFQIALAVLWCTPVTCQKKASSLFEVFSLPRFTPQPTGMPLVPSWSSLPCHALLASSQESSPLPTSLRLRGSTARLLLASCSLFQVSATCDLWYYRVHQVLVLNMCCSLPTMLALFVLLAMAIYTGVTVNFLGKRFGDWRFSWSYILGWVALLMTFFAGLFKLNCSRVQLCCHQ